MDEIEGAQLKSIAAEKTHLQILEEKQKSILSDIRSKALKIKGEPAVVDREEIVKTVLAQIEPRLVTLASGQQQLSRSYGPELSTNEFYGQAPKFPQHLLLSGRTSHIHAAIESPPGRPPSPISPALFPRARARVRSALVNLAGLRPPCSRAWTASRSGVAPLDCAVELCKVTAVLY